MAFRKEDRYLSPIQLAEDLERFLAGATVSAYREPALLRVRRWLRRHRRGIACSAAILAIAMLAGLAVSNFHSAKVLAEREHARQNVSELYRLADEAQYFTANSDSIGERVPYYDPRRGEDVAKAALAIAAQWGDRAVALPLTEEREAVVNAEYSLLLLLAQSRLTAAHLDSDLRAAMNYLDQARTVQTPTRGFYELSSRISERLGDRDAAERDQRRLQSPSTAVTAQDHFLAGEHLRLQDVDSTAAALGSAPPLKRPHLESAIDEYRSAVQLDPHHYWAQYQTGRCLLALGREQEAIEAFTGCVAIGSSSPWAYTSRGLAHAMAGHAKLASEDLNQAVKLQPTFAPALLNRGFVKFWLLHDVDAALEDFNRVFTVPSDKQLIEASFYRGQVFLSSRKLDNAITDFNAIIDSRPDFAPAHWMRAETHFLLGKFPDGLADTKEFVRLTAS
jgi:tetratricopeptide (TPR) repeat protein